MMQWTVRLEARTDKGEVKTTELVTFRRPAMASTLAEIGLTLAEAKALLTKLQASMLRDQVAEYAAHRRVCPDCCLLLEPRNLLLGESKLRLSVNKLCNELISTDFQVGHLRPSFITLCDELTLTEAHGVP